MARATIKKRPNYDRKLVIMEIPVVVAVWVFIRKRPGRKTRLSKIISVLSNGL